MRKSLLEIPFFVLPAIVIFVVAVLISRVNLPSVGGTSEKEITLKADFRKDKYGIVTVLNADGTLARDEWKITAEEVAELQASKNGIPSGVTKKEWESGLGSITGYGLGVGDYLTEADGRMLIEYAEKVIDGKIVGYGAYVEHNETEAFDFKTQEKVGDVENGKLILL